MMRETGQIQLAWTTARMARNLLASLLGIESRGIFAGVRHSQIKQMLLAFPFDDPLTPTAVNPALVPGELLQDRGVLMLKFLVGSRGRVQDSIEFSDSLLGLRRTPCGFCCATLELHGLLIGRQQQAV